ncbi:MAG: hypothetical protein NC131_06915 [Roseburia sp.]|nr:hypothetical protein [Roseburia sp.]
MKEKAVEEKVCRNCKYYVEHYVISSMKFSPIGGHCINDALYNPHGKNLGALHENCAYWETADGVKDERRERITETLQSMEKQLFYIKEILQADNK